MKSELLLPVGTMEMCIAAVHNGADAVYFGVPFFNARGRTTDFSLEELKEMIDFCHLYGVRVNLAFNVVIFQNEIPQVISLLEKILPMNPDAFIVQDLGLAQLIRRMAPHQRIHASTQMTVTNSEAIQLLDDLGIDRFVLGRENSLSEIKKIRESTGKELEVFVHGALCVAYSGQCFTSESLGGRSANRGQCAQSCRLSYELYVDDVKKDLGDKKYLVSPKDLMGIEEIPLLQEMGVNSFKVEGRLKTPEYVATAAKNYREVIDGGALNLSQRTQELATTYSRGFFSGWLHGVNHQKLVDGSFSSHRGLEIGTILELKKHSIILSSTVELSAGMGLFFATKEGDGSKIFKVQKIGKNYEVELLQKSLHLQKGQKVYLNSNDSFFSEIQKTWTSREKLKKIPLRFEVRGDIGQKLKVKVTDPEGREVEASSASELSEAADRPLTETFLKEELGSLGTTVYTLDRMDCALNQNVFLHHREIKNIRRDIVEKMNQKRITREAIEIIPFEYRPMEKKKSNSTLNILLRSKSQVEGFVQEILSFRPYLDSIKFVILDFEFGKDYLPSIELLKTTGLKVGVATTRILKPSEYYNLNSLIRCNPDVILVRNLGALEYLKSRTSAQLIGDFSLNVTNSLSLEYLTSKGLQSINLSYDLNQSQLLDLIEFSDPSKIEITLHQYMPEFHMEHCVFAAFLSTGTSFRDCGKPCERHDVKLKDSYGNIHYLKADQECRNTFYKATPQSAGFLINDLNEKGISAFRIEALNEAKEEINLKILTYLKLLKGEISLEGAIKSLKVIESYGLGQGQLNKEDTYKNRKKQEG